ncbi:MAG: murein L,D-transpeptidase family protein [Bacteroidia bacterium]
MKRIYLFLLITCIGCSLRAQSFRAEQQKAPRVKAAYSEKWDGLRSELKKQGINENFSMFIRVFKEDKQLEVWLKGKDNSEYKLFKTYSICASSGELGPKRMQGDGQVPEGFYAIAAFNPYSSYHLSLAVSYPNASDKIIGKKNLGGDIMIHGNCVTIGCMPLTDFYIKEVYILAVEARTNGQQNIPVHIFPTRMNTQGMSDLEEVKLYCMDFWKNLKEGYDLFEKNHLVPKVTVDKTGKYLFAEK